MRDLLKQHLALLLALVMTVTMLPVWALGEAMEEEPAPIITTPGETTPAQTESSDRCDHVALEAANCVSGAVCDLCGEVYGEPDQENHAHLAEVHTPIFDEATQTYDPWSHRTEIFCEDCGENLGADAKPHVMSGITCEDGNYCLDCLWQGTASETPDENSDSGIATTSLDVITGAESTYLSIHVDDVTPGQPFTISWEEVAGADHYEIAIARDDVYLVGGSDGQRENVGMSLSYTVPGAEVLEDKEHGYYPTYRIYVGAASSAFPCDASQMIKDNTVAVRRDRVLLDMPVEVKVIPGATGCTVSWSEVDGAELYGVLITNYEYSPYDEDIYDGRTTSTSITVDESRFVSGNNYHVEIYAIKSDGAYVASNFDVILTKQCAHPTTKKVYPLKPTYVNTQCTSTHHTLYQVYSLACSVCGEILEDDLQEFVCTEEHRFFPDDSCMVCGYTRQPEKPDVISCTVTEAGEGDFFGPEAPAIHTEKAAGLTFTATITCNDSTGVAELYIGNAYAYSANYTVKDGQRVFTVQLSIGGNGTSYAGTYPVRVCALKAAGDTSDMDAWNVDEFTVEHDYATPGTASSSYSYQHSNGQHKKICTETTTTLCAACGKESTGTRVYDAGQWEDCQLVSFGVPSVKTSWEYSSTGDMHRKITSEITTKLCQTCGAQTYGSYSSCGNWEAHNLDENGVCSICGYTGRNLSNTTVLNKTDPNGKKFYGNEFILFGDEEVKPGYIRFISQIPGYSNSSELEPARFISTQWGKRAGEAGTLCTYAALSMQLSYLGIDFTPGDMFENGFTSFQRPEIVRKAQEQTGIHVQTTPTGKIAATQEKLDTMMKLYETDPNYSPIYTRIKYYVDGTEHEHSVLIIGYDAQTGTYYLVDPQARTGMGSFQIGSDMTISNSNISSYNGGKITSIAQAWLTA